MKVLFPVLVLCTAAVVAVVLAIHFRVKRHLGEKPPPHAAIDAGLDQQHTEREPVTEVERDNRNHSS